jgi:deoxyadenosine/deoxycytidine kinase
MQDDVTVEEDALGALNRPCPGDGMPSPLPLVIALEANIGAGKSTQIARLQKLFEGNDRIVVLPEPVDEWVEKGFLQAMYANPDNPWLLSAFQHMVLMSLAGDLLKALAQKPTPAIIITERSPWGNYHIFGKANLEGAPMDMYHHTWERILGGLPSQIQDEVKYVYLSTTVDTIVERMAARGRAAESSVPRAYLDKLDKLHEDFIWKETKWHNIIDGNRDEEAVWQDLCVALQGWFAEAGETFKKERATRETQEREVNLTVMMKCAHDASATLKAQSLEERARKRAKIAPAVEA